MASRVGAILYYFHPRVNRACALEPNLSRVVICNAWWFFMGKMVSLLSREDVLRAADRIKPYVRRTPLEYSHWLSEVANSKVFVKLGE